ncbi:MAG: hypothetical protein HY423_02935 [Candidatus Lambdaproteobacteria bacterium]|nr:hypothetical protein [Candidatus Lambdaproteobacteria bacterium]
MPMEHLTAERLTFRSEEEVLEAYHTRNWSDGLPFILPTEARVAAMLAGAGRPGPEVIGVVPPRWAEATTELIAVNAVMAGCKAEQMPVLIAAIEAACDPAFCLYSVQATTHPCGLLMVVSGAVATRIGMNAGHGVFGPHRVNSPLGRALRLVLLNIGGAIPGNGDQSTQGSPGKHAYCIAENEAGTPWESFRATKGFTREESTVTVYAAESPHNIHNQVVRSPGSLLASIASVMATVGHNNALAVKHGDLLVALCPEHALFLARAGLTLRDAQEYLWDHARSPLRAVKHTSSPNRFANYPGWVDLDDDDALVPIAATPADINIVVTGGPGLHSSFIPTFGFTRSVTRRIEIPTGW